MSGCAGEQVLEQAQMKASREQGKEFDDDTVSIQPEGKALFRKFQVRLIDSAAVSACSDDKPMWNKGCKHYDLKR